jgi:hypothetical protein
MTEPTELASTGADVLRVAFPDATWSRPSLPLEPVFAGHSVN